jgi:hypothetical protein
MHIYPFAVSAFARSLASEGIPCVRASRFSCWPRNGVLGGPHEGGIVRRLLVQGYRNALQHTAFHKFKSADSRISFPAAARKDSTNLGLLWTATFKNLPTGTFELACHPGFFENGFSQSDPISRRREDELGWLTNPEMRAVIEERDIRLISYRQLSTKHLASQTKNNHAIERVA